MNTYQVAVKLAEKGFYLFPCKANGKEPAFNGWQALATRDEKQLARWFAGNDFNIGVFTGKFGENEALVVVDVDQKNGKDGRAEIEKLEMLGSEFPKTFMHITPTDGRHLIYKTAIPVKQGTDVLGNGLDIRSRGGYVVAVGSTIEGVPYTAKDAEIVDCPQWIVDKCGKTIERDANAKKIEGVNIYGAIERAKSYLETAPAAIEGSGGDQTTFMVACRVKDYGVDEASALGLLVDHWNNRCSPPWEISDLRAKITHAYRYGSSTVGSNSPEADFSIIPTPSGDEETPLPRLDYIDRLNSEYAFVTVGGNHCIIQEVRNDDGDLTIDCIGETSFHKRHASRMINYRGKLQPLTKVWINHEDRRSYSGFCFRPEVDAPAGKYNLWRGFSYKRPLDGEVFSEYATNSLKMFQMHALENVCDNDVELCRWLMGYFAHLIQRPFEKPLTALVFKGRKGTGKNALVERVGRLISTSFLVTADKRYLVGNFNSFLEHNLMLVLDEAFWSGDKQAEGITKNLITGTKHIIERKGLEPYAATNLTRAVIIGNEEWLVPATQDERRFAVFNVGDGRRGDNKYFHDMRVGMEQGGYRLLLKYFQDFDLSTVDVNKAPATIGLLEQKHASLDPITQWWHASLVDGEIAGSGFGQWSESVRTSDLYGAYCRYFKDRRISGRTATNAQFGRALKHCSKVGKTQIRVEGAPTWAYVMPTVTQARSDWEKYIGHEIVWDNLATHT